jgi:hypothetical protein
MICDQCETVAHCTKHGCVPKQPAPVQEPFCFVYVENGEEYFAPKGAYVPDNAQPLYTTTPAQPAPVREPLTWLKTIETPGGFGKFVEAKPNEKGAKPVYLTPPAAQPAVPDAIGPDEDEMPAYAAGWNDCRQAMLEMMK